MTASTVTRTQTLLDFAHAGHVLTGAAKADARRLLADTLLVGAAGSTAPGAAGVLDTAKSWGHRPEARIIGEDMRLPATAAAYVNAFQMHCLEWDAVHEPAVAHTMTCVAAALGAAIDRRGGADPETALTALAVGADIASGLGIAAETGLRFFRPATVGLIGAAIAVARIEGLPREKFNDVLGLAYSHLSGTMQAHSEGSIALPLQLAEAARAAIHVVDLVCHGLTGPHDPLEGEFGYFKLFDTGSLSRYTDIIGKRWLISEISIKPFPSGRASHATLAALAEIRSRGSGEIVRVTAHVPPLIAQLVGRPMLCDMTPAYARLCLPLLVALMLRDGRIDPRRFVDETYADPAICDLARKVEIVVDDNPNPNAMSPQRIEIGYGDGRRLEINVPATLGSPALPMTEAQFTAKRDLAMLLAKETDQRLFDDPLAYFTEPG